MRTLEGFVPSPPADQRIVGPVVRGVESSDAAWAVIAALLPPVGQACGRSRDHRQVLEDIVLKFPACVPWRDHPDRFGPWQTVADRLRRQPPLGRRRHLRPSPGRRPEQG
ncbi:transposase [Streptomyces sp. NPDC096339]|uniref:transposase n=1 Tax=Streptomyces sp. NPDC096339 TaxID=3366086 RepID=UPI0037F3E21C